MKQRILLSAALMMGMAFAQTQPTLSYQTVLKQALEKSPDIVGQQTTLADARADLAAKTADPSTLILPQTQAQQKVQLEALKTGFVKLQVAQNVLSAYLSVLEAQENLNVLQAQVGLDSMALDIAKAKLATKNATQLDVTKAQNTLGSSQQDLKNAQSTFPVLKEKLSATAGGGLPSTYQVTVPQIKPKTVKLDDLTQQGDERLPSLLQLSQAVTLAQMNVKFSDNDYTPRSTLDAAKSSLESAQRSLSSQNTSTASSIKDAFQNVSNSLEKSKFGQEDLKAAQQTLSQDQTRYKNGLISKYQLRQSEVAVLKAEQAQLQAQDAYLKAIAALSVTTGQDILDVVGGVQ